MNSEEILSVVIGYQKMLILKESVSCLLTICSILVTTTAWWNAFVALMTTRAGLSKKIWVLDECWKNQRQWKGWDTNFSLTFSPNQLLQKTFIVTWIFRQTFVLVPLSHFCIMSHHLQFLRPISSPRGVNTEELLHFISKAIKTQLILALVDSRKNCLIVFSQKNHFK